jgi:hypothetical protein
VDGLTDVTGTVVADAVLAAVGPAGIDTGHGPSSPTNGNGIGYKSNGRDARHTAGQASGR